MKYVVLLLLVSCGKAEIDQSRDIAQDNKIKDLQNKDNALEIRINDLESKNLIIIDSLEALSKSSNANTIKLDALQDVVNANVIQLIALSDSFTVMKGNLTTTQNNLTTLSTSLNKTIVDIIDPCGDSPGYDEVIFKTKDNKYIGYFEDAGRRYLSILNTGHYMTTDASACRFSVSSTGTILYP